MAKTDTKDTKDEVEEPKYIDKWDHRQVKNALDEAVKSSLHQIFPDAEEDFKLIDTRLWLCAICCVLSAVAWIYDWYHPYPKSHYFLLACVIPYGIFFAYLSYFMLYIEGDILCCYKNKNKNNKSDSWFIATKLPKYDPNYDLTVAKNSKIKGKNFVNEKFCIGSFIDEDGLVYEEIVLEKLKKLVEVCNVNEKDSGKQEAKKSK